MTERKNMHLTGNVRAASALFLSMTIFLLISVSVIMLGCEQVSSDTAMQCFACIQNLQKAISSALQEAEKEETGTMSLQNSGGRQLSQSSKEDLMLLEATLGYLMQLSQEQSFLQLSLASGTGISSTPLLTEAERNLLKQYNGGYMYNHYAGNGE